MVKRYWHSSSYVFFCFVLLTTNFVVASSSTTTSTSLLTAVEKEVCSDGSTCSEWIRTIRHWLLIPSDQLNLVNTQVEERPSVTQSTDEDMISSPSTTYPSGPHPPVFIASTNCKQVLLRWKSLEEKEWPIDKYVLQRRPTSSFSSSSKWVTVLETKRFEMIDTQVEPLMTYSYRLQAISNGVSSDFAYDKVNLNQSSYCSSTSTSSSTDNVKDTKATVIGEGDIWFSLLPVDSWAILSMRALHAFGTIVICFVTLYGIMRSNVTRVQGTRSRRTRLKRIRRSTAESIDTSSLYVPRSSNLSSTGSLSDITSPQSTSTSSSNNRTLKEPVSVRVQEEQVRLSTTSSAPNCLEKAEICHNCHKKFGIFRRRRVCVVCQSVALCRKCGFQAPVENRFSEIESRRRSKLGDKIKKKTICNTCCNEVFGYSGGIRQSLPSPSTLMAATAGSTNKP